MYDKVKSEHMRQNGQKEIDWICLPKISFYILPKFKGTNGLRKWSLTKELAQLVSCFALFSFEKPDKYSYEDISTIKLSQNKMLNVNGEATFFLAVMGGLKLVTGHLDIGTKQFFISLDMTKKILSRRQCDNLTYFGSFLSKSLKDFWLVKHW